MKLLALTAAAFVGTCAMANAQATNTSPTSGDAMSLGNSDMRDHRSEARRAVRQRDHRGYGYHQQRSYHPGWDGYAYAPGWSGVQVGPFGFGVWNDPYWGPPAPVVFRGPPHHYR